MVTVFLFAITFLTGCFFTAKMFERPKFSEEEYPSEQTEDETKEEETEKAEAMRKSGYKTYALEYFYEDWPRGTATRSISMRSSTKTYIAITSARASSSAA